MITRIKEPLRTAVMLRFIDSIVVDKSGCWLWQKCKRHFGYGAMFVRRPDAKQTAAHRVSYMLFKGFLPANAFICHDCDIPACVNPRHLRIADQLGNTADRINRQRTTNHISDEKILKIRERHATGKFTQKEIALEFKVSGLSVHRIVNKIGPRYSGKIRTPVFEAV